MTTTSSCHQNLKYSKLKQMDSDAEEDWQYKYRSAFTYAAENDLDHMGYEPLKRFPTPRGSRYAGFTYKDYAEERPDDKPPSSIQITVLEIIIVGFSYLLVLLTLPVSLIFSLKFIGTFERLVVLRLGRAQKLRGPGTTIVLPCIDRYTRIDLRVNAFHVPPMQIITVDRGLVELGATVFFQIKDAIASVCSIQERNQSTRTLAVTSLHRLVSRMRVSDLVSGYGKLELSEALKGELVELTSTWGIEIAKIEMSDIKVIKEGENTALSTFTKVLKSDFGNELLKSLGSAVQSFVADAKEGQKDLIEFSEADGKTLPGDGCSNLEPKSRPFSTTGNADVDLDQLLGLVSMVIDENLVGLVGHVYQIECTDLGDYYIDLKNGQGSCGRGKKMNPDVTFRLSPEAFQKFLQKKLSPFQAYMNGSIQIFGSKKAAMKLSLLSERLVHLF